MDLSHGGISAMVTLLIFVVTYFFVASEKIDKALAALAGALLVLYLRLIPEEEALRHLDLHVLLLLMGMMIIVSITEKSGLFEYLAIRSVKAARGNPMVTLVVLFILTAVLSAFLDNVSTVLLVGPVSIFIARQLGMTPYPFLVSEIFASNIGGTATLIGDPPNLLIGSAAGLSFLDFLQVLTPLIGIQVIVFSIYFVLVFRKQLHVPYKKRAIIMDMEEHKAIRDPLLLKRSVIVLSAVVGGFLLHGALHIEADAIAVGGAVALMLWTRYNVEHALKEVEWGTLLFFAGLFVIVGTMDHVGIIDKLSTVLLRSTGSDLGLTTQAILWSSGILSSILNNIPLAATYIPMIDLMQQQAWANGKDVLWWALSLGACLGGNATIVGASANVIMVDMARKNDLNITFVGFLKYSIPVTLLSLLMSSVYLEILIRLG
jgi:Na+/H+ antiporter NhaD/arsenite permease-like protein